MREIRDEILSLKNSPLYKYRLENKYHPVIGQGSHDADILFIGEAPGENEAKTGIPFCGASGKFLDELLLHIGLPREEVYIANILKDRPPQNRDPHPAEIEIYAPFLLRQIEIIKPKVIATLGRFAMEYIMNKFGLTESITKITDMHGKVYEAKGPGGTVKIVALFHPAVAIYNAGNKTELKKDFEVLKSLI
ncbi:uracil-DNA glycosylase [Candidatus Campbellbacteria bacterium CG11_big_fil_rev_8_21_14_0_20_44_21]|uniref:Type-4 uracil-DNA glycosylase n=1 Tax=Candidatus Campbellbacteria bacterium CG22_combo_CG10-13_8_21_14_all_43_18 TaxID=1974530 RepID=A0A2H0DY08_9BACT|nr:MAG: uracil-DNA glycosylase [Candidatus Campbellbacteria bacterium CG22_combo_CG10-13_8_21_14_all_43_18]PIR24453.1 MAG: uracil-DNA glycosylase [Candidatus Campbellbacteria bacterium CG11_big_fil_rev_8_21_14_0_20_44_21]